MIHHSAGGMFAIREGDWKLVLGNGSGGRQAPKGKPFGKPYFLANMKTDSDETEKLRAESESETVERLEKAFQKIHKNERRWASSLFVGNESPYFLPQYF